MSNDTVEVTYLNWTEKLKKCSTYNEFKSKLIEHFYLLESEAKKMIINYYDEDGDENCIANDDDYKSSLACPSPQYLLIVEDEENKKVEGNLKESSDKVLTQRDKILDQINDYKKNLIQLCSNIIQKKLKEKDEQLEKEINDLEKYYEESLDKFKDKIKNDTENVLEKIKETFEKLLKEKINEYDTTIKENLNEEIEKISKKCIEEIDQVKLDDMDKEQQKLFKLLQDSHNIFKEIENNVEH